MTDEEGRTIWHVEMEEITPGFRLMVDTDDPEIIAAIEASARKAGVEILRDLSSER